MYSKQGASDDFNNYNILWIVYNKIKASKEKKKFSRRLIRKINKLIKQTEKDTNCDVYGVKLITIVDDVIVPAVILDTAGDKVVIVPDINEPPFPLAFTDVIVNVYPIPAFNPLNLYPDAVISVLVDIIGVDDIVYDVAPDASVKLSITDDDVIVPDVILDTANGVPNK
jgi:hypothetical protein